MVFGGAEELEAELTHAEGGGGEVASSSSSITLAVTVAADEENSESSRGEFLAAQLFEEVWSQTLIAQ